MMSLFVKIAILSIAFSLLQISETLDYQSPASLFTLWDKKGEVKACGPALADLLALTCSGIYNYHGKRSEQRIDNNPDSDYYYNYETYPEVVGAYPFRSKRSVSSILRSTKRARGLADECCKKACSLDEMKSYCGHP